MSAVVVTTIVLSTGVALAWHPDPSSDGACDTSSGVYTATLSLTNPVADWNKDPWKMVVLNDTLDVFEQGAIVAIGDTVLSKSIVIDGPAGTEVSTSVLVGWTNGKKTIEDNKRYSASHVKSEDCIAPVVPTVDWTASQPACGDEAFTVNVTTSDGNASTQVEVVAAPAVVLLDTEMSANASETLEVPIAVGGTVTLHLFQDGEFVDERTILAPSEADCHDSQPSATFNGAVDCDGRIKGVLTINRDGMEGNFRVIVNGMVSSIVEGDTYEVQQATQPLEIHVFDPEGTEVQVDLAIVGSPNDCPVPPTTTPPTTPPTPEGELPVTGSSTLPLAMFGFTACLFGFGTHKFRRRISV